MDNEALVDAVTRIIMERVAQMEAGAAGGGGSSVVTFGEIPAGLLGPGFAVRSGQSASDTSGADFIVLTQEAFRAFHGGGIPAGLAGVGAPAAAGGCCGSETVDFSAKKVVSERDIRALNLSAGAVIKVGAGAIVTALARDYANTLGAKIVR